MKKIKNFVLSVLIVYVFVCCFMYVEQRNMMYIPHKDRLNPADYNVSNVEIAKVTTQDGVNLEGWYFGSADPKAPTIALFHGNAGDMSHRLHKVPSYIDKGYSVLLAEYRGFGGNPENPTEQGLYNDARAYLAWLEEEKNINQKQIVLYGESLGTGVAVQMATEGDFGGVVLEAPYSSTADVAKMVYFLLPIDLLMKDKFESIKKIQNVTEPILIVHGSRDRVIPITLSKKLYGKALSQKKFIEIPEAGHNDLYKYGADKDILKFIENNIDIM